MSRELINKVIAITGAAEGIGYEIADKYLLQGARLVYLLDNNVDLGTEACKTLGSKYGDERTVFMKCDVTTDLKSTTEQIFQCNAVDVLVNNAGILNETKVRRTIDVNVKGALTWGLTFWEHMRTAGNGGTIINLSSIYGYRSDQFLPTYQSTKHALIGFTRSLGHEGNYNRSCVRVVALCPGFTETAMTNKPPIWDDALQEDFAQFLSRQAWQKVEAVGDAAIKVLYMAESGSAWVIEGSNLFEVPRAYDCNAPQ